MNLDAERGDLKADVGGKALAMGVIRLARSDQAFASSPSHTRAMSSASAQE
jgi:hypothetical protein